MDADKPETTEVPAESVPEPVQENNKPDKVDIKNLFDIPEIEEHIPEDFKDIPEKKRRGRPTGTKNRPKLEVIEVPVFEQPVVKQRKPKEPKIVHVVRAPTSEEITAWHAEQVSDKRRKCLESWAQQVALSFS